jgi:hypothetical protein
MFIFFCCHVLLSQEQHSIDVLLSLSCPTSTKDKIEYILYPLLSCLASTRTTFNICLAFCYLGFASTQTTLCVQWQDHVSTTMATLYKNHKFVPNINVWWFIAHPLFEPCQTNAKAQESPCPFCTLVWYDLYLVVDPPCDSSKELQARYHPLNTH